MLQQLIKNMCKDKNLDKQDKTTLKTLLGEFDRINDGKPLTDEQCISVINKYIKNIDITLDNKYNENSYNEKMLLLKFLPKTASTQQMIGVINKVLSENTFKNTMQAMNPCIDILTEQGYYINKKALSDLLKEKSLQK